jgi:hypothetical protein
MSIASYNDKVSEIRSFAIDSLKEIALYKDIRHEETYDLHNTIFNESYYMIGYAECQEWIGNDAFRMIGDIQEAERNAFGEVHSKLDNAEKVANSWAYWTGHDVIGECHQEVIDGLYDLIVASMTLSWNAPTIGISTCCMTFTAMMTT